MEANKTTQQEPKYTIPEELRTTLEKWAKGEVLTTKSKHLEFSLKCNTCDEDYTYYRSIGDEWERKYWIGEASMMLTIKCYKCPICINPRPIGWE